MSPPPPWVRLSVSTLRSLKRVHLLRLIGNIQSTADCAQAERTLPVDAARAFAPFKK